MLVWHAEPEIFVPRIHEQFVKMSRRCRCGWSHNEFFLLLYVALCSSSHLFVQCTSPSTNFSFPTFRSADDFILFGKTQYNSDNLSFTIDASVPITRHLSYCKLFYKEQVQMKDTKSGSVASFSTSFTFSITQEEGVTNRSGWLRQVVGLTFTFICINISSLFEIATGLADQPGLRFISIEFDNYHSYADGDPSDNHIGVDINNLKSTYTYNLCGSERTTCSFPWTGRTYTAWIDYNGPTRSLELWFANGSLREGVLKPAGSGLIKVPELDLMDIFDDYMYVGFSGSVWPFLDTHEVLSWNFASSLSEAMAAPTSRRSKLFSKRILTICSAFILAIVAAIFCILGYWRMKQPHIDKSEPELRFELLMGLRRFSFKELKKATNNFAESALLGKGGSGSVYKGILTPSGMVVAVKRLNHDSEHVEREFLAEVSSISQIRHRNLVHLQGWCHEDGHFLLVFDYMSNGSLHNWLFPGSRRHYLLDPKYKKFEVLPWELRFSILAGVAAAVEYLHEEWVQCVLHRDIKSSNVLLDADFQPHLGDFGLARLIDHEKLEKTTMMAGTFGYMAPEMHYTGKATKESDVYSFGILMLEVICGRKPVNIQVEDPDDDFLLLHRVWRAYEGGNILSAVDPVILNVHSQHLTPSRSSLAVPNQITSQLTDFTLDGEPIDVGGSITIPVATTGTSINVGDVETKIVPLLHLGLQCCLTDPESRPSMRAVKQVLMQVQASTAEKDPNSALQWMPPLPSTMPSLGDLQPRSSSRVPIASMRATKAALEEVEAHLFLEMSSHGGIRRRFVTN